MNEKKEELGRAIEENRTLQDEIARAREEINMYKGKCAGLARDVEHSQAFLQKASSASASHSEQHDYLKERVRALEGDLDTAVREKTDQAYEARRLQQQVEALERQLKN